MADLIVAADAWLDSELRDPDSDVAAYLREIADQVAGEARVLAPKRTGRTAASVHTEDATDSDGDFYVRVGSRNPQTDVLNAKLGYIHNRHSKNVKRRFSKDDTVRPSHPFAREALWSVSREL